jgi:hypothetical protein
MPTSVAVEKRVYFAVVSLTNGESYYIVTSAALTELEVIKELKKRGYTQIETRYYSAAWP